MINKRKREKNHFSS